MKFLAFCAVLAAALSISACNMGNDNLKSFAHYLQGTWVSNDQSVYYGVLEITFDRITITGYYEDQTPTPGGNDNQRPFRNFTTGIALTGHSEEGSRVNGAISGHIFIEDVGRLQPGIPYTYWYETPPPYNKRVHFLLFNFGSREERLRRTE